MIFTAVLVVSGCASTSYDTVPVQSAKFMRVDEFCRKHGLNYSFDTLDDIVRIYSQDIETRLMLNSQIGYFNGNIFYMQGMPFYSQGNINIPGEIERTLFARESLAAKAPFTVKTIVIDAGHGGKDPGAISPSGLKEKDINLTIAKILDEELRKRGYRTVLTRGYDKYLTLEERVEVGRRCKADLFVSVHSNANRSAAIDGVELYYLSAGNLDSQNRSSQLARSGNGWNGSLTTKSILWDMALTKNYVLSIEMAHIFYSALKDLGFKTKPPKQANYHVLRNSYTPAVLVEAGYLSNRQEERLLRQPRYQKQVAEAIASGIVVLNKRHNNDMAKR